MKHYILIEVREPERKRPHRLDAGMLRGAIHDFCAAYSINAGDIIIREDRPRDYYGRASMWPEANRMFTEQMEYAKRVFAMQLMAREERERDGYR